MQTTTTQTNIPRERWQEHPNWPEQVLLVGSHRSFRRASQECIRRVSEGERFERAEALYNYWISGMRSHERYEEYKLYPYLEKRFGLSLDRAKAGHHELHDADRGVRSVFNALRAGAIDDTDGRDALAAALKRHDEVLGQHLDLEEEVVVPALLAMERVEFQHFLNTPITRLLRELTPS